jgi:hypothetical protein
MARRLAFTIAAGLALSGCCHDMGSYIPPSSELAKFAFHPKPHHARRTKPRHASNLEVTNVVPPGENEVSNLGTDAIDAINRAADDELRKKLIICRGCAAAAEDGHISSIWPTRAAEGFLSIEKTLRSLSSPSSNGLQ